MCALIDGAARAGADAVKFQVFRARTIYAPNAGKSAYLAKHGIHESMEKLFERNEMPYEMIPRLARRCRRRGIAFMASAFSAQDFRTVDPHVKIHKIASYEITYPELLRLAAKSGKGLILSTGGASIADIDWAVRYFRKNSGRRLLLMQCTAKYPAPPHAMNLRVIPYLARRYGVPAGLSDHSLDPVVAPVAAVALGARAVEKHFTLNRRLLGPDHAFAVTPRELLSMTRAIRRCEAALGDWRKNVVRQEEELRRFAQRAVQATRMIGKGEALIEGENMAVLRPGEQIKGLHPRFLHRIKGSRATRAIRPGQGIREKDFIRT